MEECIAKFVDHQIRKRRIEQSEAEVYQYGYRLLAEKVCALLLTFLIAVLFDAWMEILLFCIAFIPIRTFAGGYHAQHSLSCMVLSAVVLILNVITGKWFLTTGYGSFALMLEVILYPFIAWFAPVENSNRTISESERKYFKRVVVVIYAVQILVCGLLLWFGKEEWVCSVVLAHVSVAGSLVVGKLFT